MAAENTVEAPITVLDLFSGCGGLSEGFHQFRPKGGSTPVFRSIGAVEWEPAAAASYTMNFGAESNRTRYFDPPDIFCGDIVEWEPKWRPGDVDVVVGGPPCQGFSGLNRHKVRADRNKLWQEFIRVVIALQPKLFVIENVDRFVRSAEFNDLQDRIGSGDLANYQLVEPPGANENDTEWERARRYLLNAADYGASQARRRSIVIGVRTDAGLPVETMRYPEPTHSRTTQLKRKRVDGALTSLSPWETVEDLFSRTAGMKLETTELPGGRATTVKGIASSIAGPFLTTELHFARRPEPISLARYKAIPTNGNRKNLRGRYLCRFHSGAELILEKGGAPRDPQGSLDVLGTYKVVVDGGATLKSLAVRSVEIESVSLRRSKSAVYRVEVWDGRASHDATLEYLSTQAWDEHDTGTGDVMGRMRSGAPAVTIRTEFFKPEKGRYLHPTENRPITHFEAAKLQGFPDDFRWCGSKTEIAKQIGNAVPVPLGKKIAESIYDYLRLVDPGDSDRRELSEVVALLRARPSDARAFEGFDTHHVNVEDLAFQSLDMVASAPS
ncbi:DNA cytosine methyltransferase [Pseudarthrobacter sp. R1]|uniref:DNA cytosine methyltransferase n=1 Tax=Pseudarthrobacter sp. R1 TaxID=2944934 RepID=UPI00210B7C1B|nr:DNA cytosine methyltransferase [Pseudarthrobacter sp. R1]MCQ6269114.1 DNA cytosine methyltransferase [Pseudarthrobacter sp. R1]